MNKKIRKTLTILVLLLAIGVIAIVLSIAPPAMKTTIGSDNHQIDQEKIAHEKMLNIKN